MQKGYPRVAFLHLFPGGERAGPLRALRGDSKASPLPGRAAPNRPSATAPAVARRRRQREAQFSCGKFFRRNPKNASTDVGHQLASLKTLVTLSDHPLKRCTFLCDILKNWATTCQ